MDMREKVSPGIFLGCKVPPISAYIIVALLSYVPTGFWVRDNCVQNRSQILVVMWVNQVDIATMLKTCVVGLLLGYFMRENLTGPTSKNLLWNEGGVDRYGKVPL